MGSMPGSRVVGRALARSSFALLLAGGAAAQATSLVSFDWSGQLPNEDAYAPEISADGRYVAFQWYDNFTEADVFLGDRVTGAIERISVDSNEAPGNSYSYVPALTPDLRYVAFSSWATNLVAGDTNGPYPAGHDVFVRDRLSGTTERVSIGQLGQQGRDSSYHPAISADGRCVAFTSYAGNLVAVDTNGFEDVFVRDRVAGTTECVSLGTGGAEANGGSTCASISADGRFVVFYGSASNLVVGDTNGSLDVFLRDRLNGTTQRLSADSTGLQGDAGSDGGAISPDGRYVVFRSSAANLVPGDTNGTSDIFLRDLLAGTIERVSVDSSGNEAAGDSTKPTLTPDGRYVAFQSAAANLVPGDTNGRWDVFLRDRQLATTQRVSVDSNGAQGSADSGLQGPSLSANGRYVAFDSRARLVATDANDWHDIYVRDRRYAPLTSLCAPGTSGVIPCPCSNPPGGAGRGCDNSAGTGGAILSASGLACLATDSLVLTTGAERPTAMSFVLQGSAALPAGTAFGQGVRCVAGALRRLYTKAASGGGITAPDLGAGEPSVSVRSAALGDRIHAGQSRWYFVCYRDTVVLGGCPANSTFNATQAGVVEWLP